MNYSEGTALVWDIAAREAVWKQHEFIEREHIFIALCKVHALLDPKAQRDIGARLPVPKIREEMNPLFNAFCVLQLSQDILRRRVRVLLGDGNYNRQKGEVTHRSSECRKLFAAAEGLAEEKASRLMPVHLMKAALMEPTVHIVGALRELELSPEKLLKALEDTEARGENKNRKEKETPFIDRYCLDLLQQAREGKLRPLIGRRNQLLQVIRILLRTSKNNPVLIGEPGVGKTAVVQGLAQRVADGSIYPELRGFRIVELSLSRLVAGTRYRGEFEERLEGVIKELKENPNIIPFIDEIHTIVGTGRTGGALDAAGILKPALAKGEFGFIGATTITEYRRWIENDPALERRFQPVMIEEPSEEETLEILHGLKEQFEKQHGVSIEEGVIKATVELSVRYMVDKRFPDKAITVLEDACISRKVDRLSFYGELEQDLKRVGRDAVVSIISEMTRIPEERLSLSMGERILHMDDALKEKIIGQDRAIEAVSRYMKRLAAGLRPREERPGVFLFVGPTGVGKTATAKAMAEFLFGSEEDIIRVDMSEYMEKHSVAKLIGAPPGYIGYENEGYLTSRLRTRPYSVVLLDEIEKAHPDVLNLFLQVFDEGRLTDNKGRRADARHSIFIMTTNIGSGLYARNPLGYRKVSDPQTENLWREVMKEVKKRLRPEFLNRTRKVFFRSLREDDIRRIAFMMLEDCRRNLEKKRITLKIEDEALGFVCQRGYDPTQGVRHLNRAIEELIDTPLSEMILESDLVGSMTVKVCVEGEELIFQANFEAPNDIDPDDINTEG